MGNMLFAKCMPENPPGFDFRTSILESPYFNERQAAVKAVSKACFLCTKIQENLVSDETFIKKDRSPVTIADLAVQTLIIHEIMKEFPEYPFIAEEESKSLKDKTILEKVLASINTVIPDMDENLLIETIDKGKTPQIGPEIKRWWTLDPIDGTLGFLRKQQYAVCLALIEDGEVVLGVLGCPALPLKLLDPSKDTSSTSDKSEEVTELEEKEPKELEHEPGCILVGLKDHGSFIRGLDVSDETEIEVSALDSIANGRLVESYERSHSAHDTSAEIAQELGITQEPVRIDSQCKYALVARGEADVYLRISSSTYKECIWDHAAGTVIVKAAGGEVTDLDGKQLDFTLGRKLIGNRGVVATNGIDHKKVLAAIAAVEKRNSEKQPEEEVKHTSTL